MAAGFNFDKCIIDYLHQSGVDAISVDGVTHGKSEWPCYLLYVHRPNRRTFVDAILMITADFVRISTTEEEPRHILYGDPDLFTKLDDAMRVYFGQDQT